MQFCAAHWTELKDAIAARDLGGFVAADGRAVLDKMMDEMEEGRSSTTFEPLMGAHNAIVANAMSAAGLGIMADNDDGTPRCPVCYLIGSCGCAAPAECEFRGWIGIAADEQLEIAVDLGLTTRH